MTKQIFRIISLLMFVLSFNAMNIFGQIKENNKDFDNFSIRTKGYILGLIAIPRPSVTGSIEFRYKKNSIDITYGQQYAFLTSADPDTIKIRNFGNNFRVHVRHYLPPLKNDSLSFPFISVGYYKIFASQNVTQHWFSGARYTTSAAIQYDIHVFCIPPSNYILSNNQNVLNFAHKNKCDEFTGKNVFRGRELGQFRNYQIEFFRRQRI